MSGQRHVPALLYPRERPGTLFTGDWVGPGAWLDGPKISSPPGFFYLYHLITVDLFEH